jgi:hypothetical protein
MAFAGPDADPIRKARFREATREIVAKDRHDRKYGFAVDTAGAVARAMERAYRQGFADAQDKSPMPVAGDVQPGEAINWALIPPRPRSAFWTICLFVLGKGERTQGAGHLVPATTGRGTRDGGWGSQADELAPGLLWPASGRSGMCCVMPTARSIRHGSGRSRPVICFGWQAAAEAALQRLDKAQEP